MDFNGINGAKDRKVISATREGEATRVVRARRGFAAAPETLWDAITNPDRLGLWFSDVSGRLTEGGRFSITGNADGDILTCTPHRDIVLTWEMQDSTSWLSLHLQPAADETILTLDHETPLMGAAQKHWDTYGPGATGVGWDWAMVGLDRHLSAPEQPLIDAGMAWAQSAAGKDRLRDWANAWGQAHIANGTAKAKAMDAAKSTADFYTGS